MPTSLQPIAQLQNKNYRVLTVVLDGVGYVAPQENLTRAVVNGSGVAPTLGFLHGNAVNAAYTPHLHRLMSGPLARTLLAHGPAVGLPSEDDMGNSEVGHNALGAGRVFAQGAKLVNEAIATKAIFKTATWKKVVARPELTSGTNTLHLLGLLSDGNVHSHINHLFALIEGAKASGVKRVRLHLLLDGRDVPPSSAMTYVDLLENFLKSQVSSSFDCCVASGGGRMIVTMDRYESDWTIVERGYHAHVLGEGRFFPSLKNAIETFRTEGHNNDQNLPPFVITAKGVPVGKIIDDDSVVLFNFRGDRAIQISRALTQSNFVAFPRIYFPRVVYAGMMQYDGDLKLPELFLVDPPVIENTIGELLSAAKVHQFACSETQKYGHVTFFWNGNRSGKFDEAYEHYCEIPSDLTPYEERPWMKAAEIADETIRQMKAESFKVGRINFANGDMVGHTGNFSAGVVSVASCDLVLGRILAAAVETNTIVILTADHGNVDEMFERDKKTGLVALDANKQPKIKTSHTLAPVPFAIFNHEILGIDISLRDDLPKAGLANIAATTLMLAGFEPPVDYEPTLIRFSKPFETNDQDEAQKRRRDRKVDDNAKLAIAATNFAETIARLRAPKDGCPWDLEQTVSSLTKFMAEECYEAIHAAEQFVRSPSPETAMQYCDELGDVLLQVFLNAQIISEQKYFSIEQVFQSINEKMIRRHPHVFAKATADTSTEVLNQWEKIKQNERGGELNNSLLNKATKKRYLPTLSYAYEVAKQSYKVGFAWDTLQGVFNDLASEVEEFRQEIFASSVNWTKAKDELGDIAYALACVTAHLTQREKQDIDLDTCARAATEKFVTRFKEMENILAERKTPLTTESAKNLTLDEWNTLWKLAKQRRYQ